MQYTQAPSSARKKNLKRSFISTVRPTVHTNPSRKRSFSKTLSKPEEIENTRFSFLCKWKTFWKKTLFENDDVQTIMWFPDRVFLKHKSKVSDDCCIFKFLRP